MEFQTADHELTDAEIIDHYGELLAAGVSAFRADPEFVVTMGETAAKILAKRESRNAVGRYATDT